jgi:hypothetical protein
VAGHLTIARADVCEIKCQILTTARAPLSSTVGVSISSTHFKRPLVASKHSCLCGATIQTNLYEGHSLFLLVPEEATDHPDLDAEASSSFIVKLIRESKVVARCASCGVLSLVDNDYRVQFFTQVDGGVASADI